MNEQATSANVGRMVIFAGTTGAGKNTIINELLKRCPSMKKLITATTRKMRPGEEEGIDHYYISNQEFQEHIHNNNVAEYVHFEERDVYYGSLNHQLEEQLSHPGVVLAEVQLIGAKYFKEHYDALTIFIEPESLDVLERRIRARSSLDEYEIKNRLAIAEHEIEHEAPFYDMRIANRDGELEQTINRLMMIFKELGIQCE